MESLDQVFLKAYAKQTIALTELPAPPEPVPESHPASCGAATEPSTPKIPDPEPERQVECATSGSCETRPEPEYRRMDSAHRIADGDARPPHTPFSPPVVAPPEASPDTVRRPGQKQAVAISMLQMAAPPEVPAEPESLDDFSPDWELDRFVWPDLCQRLLTAEHRYFRHVGEQLKAATDQSQHVVMVSGCRRGEGRTTLALCLARSAAAAGVDVAVVDADWENPQLGPSLGLEAPCGWNEVLAGDATLNEAAVASVEDRVTLFPLNGRNSFRNGWKDRSPSQLMRAISARFPLVIIDAGPWNDRDPLTEPDGRECLVDAAIVVRDLRRTDQEEALQTARSLQASGIIAVGIAENFEAH